MSGTSPQDVPADDDEFTGENLDEASVASEEEGIATSSGMDRGSGLGTDGADPANTAAGGDTTANTAASADTAEGADATDPADPLSSEPTPDDPDAPLRDLGEARGSDGPAPLP